MSRILHLLNMSLRYSRSKGVREYRLEEPPLGSLAAPCHPEENASHHNNKLAARGKPSTFVSAGRARRTG